MNRERIRFRIDYSCPLKKTLLYAIYKQNIIDSCLKCEQIKIKNSDQFCKLLGKNFNWFDANWWEHYIKQGQLIILEEIEI